MATENVEELNPRIRRLLEYLSDDIKVMPQALREPFRLVHDCLVELGSSEKQG